MYRLFATFYPKPIKQGFIQLLLYSNLRMEPNRFLGFIFLFNTLTSLFLGFVFGQIYSAPFWIISILSFLFIEVTFYFWLLVYADKKARFAEEVLPDALLLMSSNLRAGFTTDKALLLAARPEFGPLRDEITQVGKEITAGREVATSLLAITTRIRSQKLARALELIVSGLKSGGKLADLLQETALDFKNQALVDRKIRTSVNMYMIFVFFAVAIGAPLLFGLSSYLVEVLSIIFKSIEVPSTVTTQLSLPLSFKSTAVSPTFVTAFSVLSLTTTSVFGAFVIGLISKGREKDGITLLPLLLLLALGIFFLVRFLARSLLGNLFLF
ncbi:type II secretion system F family protein [Candidatus Woesearchaeota archaeon]|nr:type II secretion system F family protein [Candidatus Woesearchaeota archaeon]